MNKIGVSEQQRQEIWQCLPMFKVYERAASATTKSIKAQAHDEPALLQVALAHLAS